MSENELMVSNMGGALMPVMDIAQAKAAYTAMVDFVKSIMRENTDFGVVPGTKKPTLLKPGAEKLCRFFGLSARFDLTKEMEEWFADEPFFSYRYKCSLYSLATGALVGEGEGSCNSHEKKYRYRNAARACPECGKEAIYKGKKEYGGGWYCNTKAGGCGAKFPDSHFSGDAPQQINPDMADLPNTLQKMAQKRAFIAATLIAVNASEFFTQDVEDLHYGAVDGEYTVTDDAPKPVQTRQNAPKTTGGDDHGQPQAETPKARYSASGLRDAIMASISKRADQHPDDLVVVSVDKARKLAQTWRNIMPKTPDDLSGDKARFAITEYLIGRVPKDDKDAPSFKGLSVVEHTVLETWLSNAPVARVEAKEVWEELELLSSVTTNEAEARGEDELASDFLLPKD